MLEPMPAWHVPLEWAAIAKALAPAIARDPRRDSWTVLDQAVSCDLDFWRASKPLVGFAVTQTEGRTFWVIYVGGIGGTTADKREAMTVLEQAGRRKGCAEIKFEGRDWRRVFPDFSARRSDDGRWHFRKALI